MSEAATNGSAATNGTNGSAGTVTVTTAIARTVPRGDPSRSSAPDGRLLPPLPDLLRLADDRADAYRAAAPFPHAVLDGLFDPDGLRRVAHELPARSAPGWTTWDTSNEWKHVFDQPEHFGPGARRLADDLNSSEFVRFLERLTGIDGLVPDPHLTAAGYFDVERGGFLGVHVDFARNPKLALVRRVNVLVYLNEGWREDWGGQLELWADRSGGPVQRIVPVFNRMVVFSTPDALHGHPEPISAPEGRSRLCFSAYYFTSPDQPDSPQGRNGVLFSERSDPPGCGGGGGQARATRRRGRPAGGAAPAPATGGCGPGARRHAAGAEPRPVPLRCRRGQGRLLPPRPCRPDRSPP